LNAIDSLGQLVFPMIGKNVQKCKVWSIGLLEFYFGTHDMHKDEPYGLFQTGSCVEWRLENATTILVGSRDGESTLKDTNKHLSDKRILNIVLDSIALDVSIEFENNIQLKIFTAQKDRNGEDISCWTLSIFDQFRVRTTLGGQWILTDRAPRYSSSK